MREPMPKSENGTLRKTIQVRKTQELERLQAERREAARGLTEAEKQDLEQARRTINTPPTPPVTKKTQTTVQTPAATPAPALRRSTLSAKQIILLVSLVGVLTVAMGLALFAALSQSGSTDAAPTSTVKPLPMITVGSIADLLKKNGYVVANQQSLPVPNQNWQAKSALQLSLSDKSKNASLVLFLAYDSPDTPSQDSFRATLSESWKKWSQFQVGNLLVLFAPDTKGVFADELKQLLTSAFVLPYRSAATLTR